MAEVTFEIKEQDDGKWAVIVHKPGSIDTGATTFETESEAQAWIDAQGKQQR